MSRVVVVVVVVVVVDIDAQAACDSTGSDTWRMGPTFFKCFLLNNLFTAGVDHFAGVSFAYVC